jgi:protein-L-isoaspartate(D-aspartate) O-methyltransferase
MDYAAARKVMVDSQVRVNDVTDRSLQAALLGVPRERFCAPDRAFAAYAEVETPITATRRLMMARDLSKLVQALDARAGETALVVAGPYAAAVLAALGLTVTAQEADAAVFDIAGEALAEAGVTTVVAPVTEPTGGDYDVIVSEKSDPVRPGPSRGLAEGAQGRRPSGRGRARRSGRQGRPLCARSRRPVAPRTVRFQPPGYGRNVARGDFCTLESIFPTEGAGLCVKKT